MEQEIVRLRNEGKRQIHLSIYDSYTMIGDTRYEFERQKIYGRINVVLPNDFIDLPLSFAKLKYISEDRPKVIKSSKDTSIDFAFNYRPEKLNRKEVPYIAKGYAAAIRKIFPSNEFMECGTFFLDSKKEQLMSWYEYLSPDFKEKLYNLHGFLGVEGRLMQVSFHCSEAIYKMWRPAALEVFASIYSSLDRQMNP